MPPGRKPYQPTNEQRKEVEALAACGVTETVMSDYLGITEKTLRKYYRKEIDAGKSKGHAKVSRFLFEAASGAALAKGASHSDCIRAAMFYAKTQMNWRETNVLEIEDNRPPLLVRRAVELPSDDAIEGEYTEH